MEKHHGGHKCHKSFDILKNVVDFRACTVTYFHIILHAVGNELIYLYVIYDASYEIVDKCTRFVFIIMFIVTCV